MNKFLSRTIAAGMVIWFGSALYLTINFFIGKFINLHPTIAINLLIGGFFMWFGVGLINLFYGRGFLDFDQNSLTANKAVDSTGKATKKVGCKSCKKKAEAREKRIREEKEKPKTKM